MSAANEGLDLFACVIQESSNQDCATEAQFIEFYWAEDRGHALDQASDAHPGEWIGAIAWVPYNPSLPEFAA